MQNYRDVNDAYMNGGIEEEIPISPYVLDVEHTVTTKKRKSLKPAGWSPQASTVQSIGDDELKQ